MRIAIPVANNTICMHFGHCEQFYLFDVDVEQKTVSEAIKLTPPPHEPGAFPRWLNEQKVNLIIAGGMGQGARNIFAQNGIEVYVGAPTEEPKKLIEKYIEGKLTFGVNACDH